MCKISVDDIVHCIANSYEYSGEIKELEDCQIFSKLLFKAIGDFIEVKGNVSGTVTLECDRCLTKYKHEFNFDINETFAKNALYDEYSSELELAPGQFITDLNGEEFIDIYDLLYQSVILNLPNKKVCGINCNERYFVSDEDMNVHDSRMDVFKNIKIEN